MSSIIDALEERLLQYLLEQETKTFFVKVFLYIAELSEVAEKQSLETIIC